MDQETDSYYKEQVSLSEVLDRVLHQGVVISGDIIISVADIDLIYVGLRVLLTSVDNLENLPQEKLPDSNDPLSA